MKETKTSESHEHVWIETTLARDSDGVMISHACDCGMWKIEPRQAKFDPLARKHNQQVR